MRRVLLVLMTVLVGGCSGYGDAVPETTAGQEATEAPAPPSIQTAAGVLTIPSVDVANQFPWWCTQGAPDCISGRGRQLLAVQLFSPEMSRDGDLSRSLSDAAQAVTVVADDGTEWPSALRQWQLGAGLFLVREGVGWPETVTLTWPGNEPVTLTVEHRDD